MMQDLFVCKEGRIVTRIEKQTIATPRYQRRLGVTELRTATGREQLQRFFLLFFNDSKSISSTKNTMPILRPSENKQAG